MFNTITFEEPIIHADTKTCLLAFGHGTGVALYYIFLDILSKSIPATMIAMINTMPVVVLLIAQYTILKDIFPGNRNLLEVFGVVMVVVGNILAAIAHSKD